MVILTTLDKGIYMKNWQAVALSVSLAAFLYFIWYLTAIHYI
jgi:hypothetical protein